MSSVIEKENSPDKDIYMYTAKGFLPNMDLPDIRMATAKGGFTLRGDIHMETLKGGTTVIAKQNRFKLWERELLEAPEVKRKSTVAQLCEFYYAFVVI